MTSERLPLNLPVSSGPRLYEKERIVKRLSAYTFGVVAILSTSYALPVSAADAPDPDPLMEDLHIEIQAVAQFDYEGQTISVWESMTNRLDNKDNPSKWQFRYDPLFIPEMDSNGKPSLKIVKMPKGFRIKMPVYLTTEKAKAEAFRRVKDTLSTKSPSDANQISSSNVTVLDIRSIQIAIPDLNGERGVKVNEKRTPYAKTQHVSSVDIDVLDMATAGRVVEHLPSMKIEYTYRHSAKQVQKNRVSVSYRDLKNTALYEALDGLGTTATFVHRDDLRKLVEESRSELTISKTLESPEKLDNALLRDILEKMAVKQNVASAAFDAEKFKATYNAEDLAPTTITESLNKMFKKHQTKDEWENSGSHDVSGKASVVDFFSGEASSKGTHTTKGLKELLEQHDIHVEFKGNKIVAKSIDLHRINLSDFDKAQKLTDETMLVASAVQSKTGTLDLAFLSNNSSGDTSLVGKVASLKNESSPIGSIIAYGGPISPATSLPSNWRLCDGAVLDKNKFPALWNAIGYSWGGQGETFNLPDLRGQFLRGFDKGGINDPDGPSREVGSLQAHSLKSHNHPASASSVAKTSGPPEAGKGGVGEGYLVLRSPRSLSETGGGLGAPGGLFQDGDQRGISRANLEITVSVNNSEGTTETRPINRSVNWIIRVE